MESKSEFSIGTIKTTLVYILNQFKKYNSSHLVIPFCNYICNEFKLDHIDVFVELFNVFGLNILSLDLMELIVENDSLLKILLNYSSILHPSSIEKIPRLKNFISSNNIESIDFRLLPFIVYLKDVSLSIISSSNFSEEELLKFNIFFKNIYKNLKFNSTLDLMFELQMLTLLKSNNATLFKEKFLSAYVNSNSPLLFIETFGFLFMSYMYVSISNSSFLEFVDFCSNLNSFSPIKLNYFAKLECVFITGILLGVSFKYIYYFNYQNSFYNYEVNSNNIVGNTYFMLTSLTISATNINTFIKKYFDSNFKRMHLIHYGAFISILFNDYNNYAEFVLLNGKIEISEYFSNPKSITLQSFNYSYINYIRVLIKLQMHKTNYYQDHLSFILLEPDDSINSDSLNKSLDVLNCYLNFSRYFFIFIFL